MVLDDQGGTNWGVAFLQVVEIHFLHFLAWSVSFQDDLVLRLRTDG